MDEIELERVKRMLTLDGSIPEDYAFLVDAAIYVWNPNTHFRRFLIHSDQLAHACREYLRASGRVFESLEQAKAVAIAERWLNWEKLLAPYDPYDSP